MNFNGRLFVWWVLYITNPCLTEGAKECVQRRLGACKVLSAINNDYSISLKDFHSPQPAGFALKTSIEINLLENMHSLEYNLPVERKRTIGYNLDNAALVYIYVDMNISYINIHLGQKYYRLSELQYSNYVTNFTESKYNRYTPSLPTFPYNLHLEITTNGTFSVYADANTEPFFEYQLTQDFNVEKIGYNTADADLIAFVDCSVEYKQNCGSHRVDRIYGCRESLVKRAGIIENFEEFEKAYGEDVLFDEFIIVQTEYVSEIVFIFEQHRLNIDFKFDSMEVQLLDLPNEKLQKSVRTEQLFEVPASPYVVRVLLTTVENNSFFNISNLRSQEILSLNLCVDVGSLRKMVFFGPRLYFDCLHSDEYNSTMISERVRKIKGIDTSEFEYHEYGYNYTKAFLDIGDFVSEPFVMYHHEFGNTTQDWCKGEPKPSKYDNDSVQAVIEKSNAAVLAELKEINAQNAGANTAVLTELKEINVQNKAIADANTANTGANTAVLTLVLTELEKISKVSVETNKVIADTNEAIADASKAITNTNEVLLSEFRSVKASIDALATHLQQNITSVNNNYNNNLNVTEFLKILKQN